MLAYTSHGLWDWAGAAGAIFLGLVTTFGGLLALNSFLSSNDESSHAHMHLMFMRFMDARPKILPTRSAERLATAEPHGTPNDTDFGGSALYFLEEVYAWTRSRTKTLDNRLLNFWKSRAERWYQRDIVESWRATITTQLITYRAQVLPSLVGFTSCYGLEFLRFAEEKFDDPALSNVIRRSNAAALAGLPRVLGTEEEVQRAQLKDLPLKKLPADE